MGLIKWFRSELRSLREKEPEKPDEALPYAVVLVLIVIAVLVFSDWRSISISKWVLLSALASALLARMFEAARGREEWISHLFGGLFCIVFSGLCLDIYLKRPSRILLVGIIFALVLGVVQFWRFAVRTWRGPKKPDGKTDEEDLS